MSVKNLILSAAGAAGGGGAYIEDVFSTYLYNGTSYTQTIRNGIDLASGFNSQSVVSRAIPSYSTLSSGISVASSGSFTFEGFFFVGSAADQFFGSSTTTGNLQLIRFNQSNVGTISCYTNGTSIISSAGAVSLDSWQHIAVVRSGSTLTIYVEGTSVASGTASEAFSLDILGQFFLSGSPYLVGSTTYLGYVSDVRFSNIAVYTGNFTPPSGPLSVTANTQLLCYQTNNQFSDASGNIATITPTNLEVSKFGPFAGPSADNEGGMVWIKSRSAATNNFLFDTERGVLNDLNSNTTDAEASLANSLTSFNSDGFSIGGATGIGVGLQTYTSWTFRKAPKFFDVVTWTGTGSARTVSHNLGSVPGCIIVKRTDSTGDWIVYHRANTANPETDYLELNDTAATADLNTMWNDTAPTSTEFTVGTDNDVNASAATYVAYLFAHDAGGFGDDGSENVISCGSYTGNGSATGPVVNLGWEPQWLLIKKATATGNNRNWWLTDSMRGFVAGTGDFFLFPNTTAADSGPWDFVNPTATGFQLTTTDDNFNTSSVDYIYIAIRRGPMKTPTSGTEVFGVNARSGTGANATVTGGQTDDAVLIKNRGSAVASLFSSRLTGTNYLVTSSTAAEVAAGTTILQANPWDVMDGVKVGTTSTITNASSNTFVNYMFHRAPGFFDVMCYTGDGTVRTINHNLGAVPELGFFFKRNKSDTFSRLVFPVNLGADKWMKLNVTDAVQTSTNIWANTLPTSSVITLGASGASNEATTTYVAYLFATLAGVSKVGSYTGNGTSVSVTTGFQPRFILVKRTDSTGNWIVGDSARGLVAGDDPFLELNTTDAEVTNEDWVDVSATGFTINETAANANVNTGTYIYLAIS